MNLRRSPLLGAVGSRIRARVAAGLALWALPLSGLAAAPPPIAGVAGSKHDLSLVGPGPIKAVTESGVCVFCHTPHHSTSDTPLWNRSLSTAVYVPYSSSTMKAIVGQPSGSSKLCLSCHDGTIALGLVNTRPSGIQMQNGVTTFPPGPNLMGTDLSHHHPVSFTYDKALVAANGQLADPSTLNNKVRLDPNQQVQCTSCHDPHNNQFGVFLVQDNTASALCLSCHSLTPAWPQSAHGASAKTWNGSGLNPWPSAKATLRTPAANACGSCHAAHVPGGGPRLLRYAVDELNCYTCHAGTVAAMDIKTEFDKLSVHPITGTTAVHDPMEDPLNAPRHVKCVDCHNPHAARHAPAQAPAASGALAAVKGANLAGSVVNPLTKEYELCLRCHGDNLSRSQTRVSRQYSQTSTRLKFSITSASYHPVAARGRNANVPSLLPPYTTGSLIYCTDCHNNDQGPGANGAGPRGPHGSTYPPLLERALIMTDGLTESPTAYALCYKCHDRDRLFTDQSFPHRKHVQDARNACTSCHDPHGVQQKGRLISFNTLYATKSSNGRLDFNQTGLFRGNCSVTCHGKDHRATPYPQ